MDYTVVRSTRGTMALQITRDARVVVRVPCRASDTEIKNFIAAHQDWVEKHLTRRLAYLDSHPPLTEDELVALRDRAKAYLPMRVAYWAARMGVIPAGVRITAARTRFGSCSGKNSLSFSLHLMQYPPQAIDYVIVHELSHIRHKNHSPAFYAEVARYLPDYKARQTMLKQ